MTIRRYSADEIVGAFLCSDIEDIKDQRYQPTRFNSPPVFNYDLDGFELITSPPKGKKVPANYGGYKWEKIGEIFGREVWAGKSDMDE